MAIQVSSISELQRVMMAQVQECMEKSSDNLIEEIKQSLDETVYNYEPDRYIRTNQLKDTLELDESQSITSTTQASMVVNHNTDNAVWFSVANGEIRKDIPEIVTYGAYGTFAGQGVYVYGSDEHTINPRGRVWGKPKDYMKHAEEKLEGYGYLNRCLSPHLPPHITIK